MINHSTTLNTSTVTSSYIEDWGGSHSVWFLAQSSFLHNGLPWAKSNHIAVYVNQFS
ncbi:hypothetical protein ACRRTK_020851 [Alexandromys fortis]